MRYLALILLVLVLAPTALASTKLDATKVTWYLKGEGDAVLPSLGLVLTDLKCKPTTTKYVTCTNRTVTPDYKKVLCDEGKFYIKNFAVTGQWDKPHACKPTA